MLKKDATSPPEIQQPITMEGQLSKGLSRKEEHPMTAVPAKRKASASSSKQIRDT